jgi:DNA-binding NtrC family response regulator
MSSRSLILHLGYDALLSEARGIILEDAGYEVVLVDAPDNAIRVLKTQEVSLVVACHSVPPDELAAAVQQMKRVRPRVPVVVVHVGGLLQPQRSLADGFIDGLRGPEHLLSRVAGTISRNHTTTAAS